MTTSTPASASSPASISPVGPAPAITTPRGLGQASRLAGELTGRLDSRARDLGDEVGDEALDLGRRKVVARARVWLSEIAADDERAQSGPGQVLRLRDAEPADHLHGGHLADA